MADVLHRLTKQLRRSVNTPDFPEAEWIRNPDVASVAGLPAKYWKIAGDAVLPMDAAEQAAADAAQADAELAEARSAEKARFDGERVLKALALTMLDEINLLRSAAGLTERTPAQLAAAVKGRVDTL